MKYFSLMFALALFSTNAVFAMSKVDRKLINAANEVDYSKVEKALKIKDVNVNAEDEDGNTAFAIAAYWFKRFGDDKKNARKAGDQAEEDRAISNQKDARKILNALLKKGAEPKTIYTKKFVGTKVNIHSDNLEGLIENFSPKKKK